MTDSISNRIASYVAPETIEYEWRNGYRTLCVGHDSDGWWFNRFDAELGSPETDELVSVEQINDLFRWLEGDK